MSFSLIAVLVKNGEHFLKFAPDIFDEGMRFVTKAITFKLEKYDIDALRDLLSVLVLEGIDYFLKKGTFKRLVFITQNYILLSSLPCNEYSLKDVFLDFSIKLLTNVTREEKMFLIFQYHVIQQTKRYKRPDMECICGFL